MTTDDRTPRTRASLLRTPIATYGRYGYVVNVFTTRLGREEVARVEWRVPCPPATPGDRVTFKRTLRSFHGAKRVRELEARRFAEALAQVLQLEYEARRFGPLATLVPRSTSTAPGAPTESAYPVLEAALRPTLVTSGPTLGELWAHYEQAHRADWAPRTLVLNRGRWEVLAPGFLPSTTYALSVTPDVLDDWRVALSTIARKHGRAMAGNQIAHHTQLVKSVYAFGVRRGLLAHNPIREYRVRRGRSSKPLAVPAFTSREWARLLAVLDYRKPSDWRAWALIALDGLLAPRSLALLKLQWRDLRGLSFEEPRTVRWRGEHDKVGNERVQPLPRDAVRVLRICRVWARREGYSGDYVFFGAQARTRHRHYTYSALNGQLVRACDRAKVPRLQYQAMHGLRRLSGTRVLEDHGDVNAAADWLGDVDLGALKRSYLRTSPEYLRPVADRKTLPETARQPGRRRASSAPRADRNGDELATTNENAPRSALLSHDANANPKGENEL
jgi:site-specific recombinase XerC